MPAKDHIVLVVPADNFIALAVIRSLGRNGVKVLAMSGPEGIGRYSRYCWTHCSAPSDNTELVARVQEAIERYRVTHIICTGESAILRLNEHRELLERRVKLLFPRRELFDLALYKDKTLALAESLGIDIPKTVIMERGADVAKCRDLTFPVILKPRHQDVRVEAARRLNFKIRYAASYAELLKILEELRPAGEYPLIQEYVEGLGVGVNVIMHNGQPVQLFQHRRIREFPPKGGVSVFCESAELERDLAERSVALLRAMNWEGAAMVEYRRDPRTKRTVIMEVNGRFWGSLPLAIHAGADFPYQLYKSSEQQDLEPATTKYSLGLQCRALTGDTKWLYSVLKDHSESRAGAIWAYLRAFRPGVRYFAWSLTDPLPAVMNVVFRLRRIFSRGREAG